MSCSQHSNLKAPADEERIRADQERVGSVADERSEVRRRERALSTTSLADIQPERSMMLFARCEPKEKAAN
jgi:hypothetical protein